MTGCRYCIREVPNFLISQYALRNTRFQNFTMIDICDIELIGARLEAEGLVINLSKEYYEQEIIEESRARELLKICGIANLVGKQIIRLALQMGMAKGASVRII